jgi:hypothetical protein
VCTLLVAPCASGALLVFPKFCYKEHVLQQRTSVFVLDTTTSPSVLFLTAPCEQYIIFCILFLSDGKISVLIQFLFLNMLFRKHHILQLPLVAVIWARHIPFDYIFQCPYNFLSFSSWEVEDGFLLGCCTM